MPRQDSSSAGDVVTYMLAVALAAGSIGFAGYKVIKLRNMEDPPADLGLNFPPPKRKIITDPGIDLDNLKTNTITPADGGIAPSQLRQPYSSSLTPVESYKLLTVIDGVAFVELKTFRGKEIVPVTQGATLRGAGKVDVIAKEGGRWTLVTSDMRLVADKTPQ
jgi:hypothetical protein